MSKVKRGKTVQAGIDGIIELFGEDDALVQMAQRFMVMMQFQGEESIDFNFTISELTILHGLVVLAAKHPRMEKELSEQGSETVAKFREFCREAWSTYGLTEEEAELWDTMGMQITARLEELDAADPDYVSHVEEACQRFIKAARECAGKGGGYVKVWRESGEEGLDDITKCDIGDFLEDPDFFGSIADDYGYGVYVFQVYDVRLDLHLQSIFELG